jgi:hypothetical protein
MQKDLESIKLDQCLTANMVYEYFHKKIDFCCDDMLTKAKNIPITNGLSGGCCVKIMY